MFDFGQDLSNFLLNANVPPSNYNFLQQAFMRAQKRPLEAESGFPTPLEAFSPFQPSISNTPEFYRLLETFFNCVLKSRGKSEAVSHENTAASGRIIWPPQLLPATAATTASNSSSQVPSPSLLPPRKQIRSDAQQGDSIEDSVSKHEFSTPALNSLIEMTLSKTYHLSHTSGNPKGKSCQKHSGGATLEEVGSGNTVGGRTPKRRKTRTTFTSFQLAELEVYFSKQKYLTPADRDQIANELGLSSTQVITWFQNRRAKKKREVAELERDLLAAKRSREKGLTFGFESSFLPQAPNRSSPAPAECSADSLGVKQNGETSTAGTSTTTHSTSSVEDSACSRGTEVERTNFRVPPLSEMSDHPQCKTARIWRPVCLE